ncbi:hypothetical protein SHM7688_03545 [Shimia marina]|uniref:Uncharacterized protein n=1 Tax=Shimia marina TaxID=321267 RepID=A0A0P1FEJ0_9RHOB|nr:hypothetical protein SHM7688_03545 [Shimia marina]
MRGQHRGGGGAAGARNKPGALIHDLRFGQPRIGNGLAHGDMGIGRTRPHEAQGALVDMFLDVDVDMTGDLAAEAMLAHLRTG